MARAVRLRLEVEPVVLVGGNDVRHPPVYSNSVSLELLDLARIVREQANRADGQAREHVRRDRVVALVVVEAEGEVRVHRIQPAVLQSVGADLVDQAYPPALLAKV